MTIVANPATRLHLNDIHPPFDSQLLRFFAEKLEGIKMIKQQRKTYTKPVLNAEAFVPDTYVAACNFTTYKMACTVNGTEDSDRDGVSGTHRSSGCQNDNKQIITFDSNGYLKLYELENNYFAGGACTLLASPSDDTPITLHKDNVRHGMTLYWKTSGTNWGGWECIHQGIINLDPNNKGNLS